MKSLLDAFDQSVIRYAFAYGSSAFRQTGYTSKQLSEGMLDLMLVVKGDLVETFHPENMVRNPEHYSRLMKTGHYGLMKWVQHSGAGVFFNTDVRVNGQRAKYGVTSEDTFLRDLDEWETLYLAGRLHKPVKNLIEPDKQIDDAKKDNLNMALHAALLMLPETFTRSQLLETLVSISYLGDIRRFLAENPKKAQNIVEGQSEELWRMYDPCLEEVGLGEHLERLDSSGERWSQNCEQDCRYLRLLCLPSSVRIRVGRPKDFSIKPSKIRSALASIGKWPSVVQSVKGLVTADPSTSARYLFSKIAKRFK